jgi:predicted dehydrogenase
MANEGRVGIIGLGGQGSCTPLIAEGMVPSGHGIEAICDVDPAEAEIVLSTDPGVPRYEDYITMLGGGDVDAVVTCVPH